MHRQSIHWLLFSILLAGGLASCNPARKEKPAATGDYDLEAPEKFNMPESLFEISGIAFDRYNHDTVYAVQDEEGKVFRLAWDVPRQLHTKFAKKGDYEDLAVLKGKIYVLKSNGTVYAFDRTDVDLAEQEKGKEFKHLLPEGEYEGMFADEASGQLYIICKKCVDDDTKSNVTGYILKPAPDSLSLTGTFQVPVAPIKALTGKIARGFRPSGLARNPLNGNWYIISAVNKLLVVTDGDWKAKEVFTLNGNIFIQPEGIAFDKQGNLFISNEGDDLFNGNILKFSYRPAP